MSVPFTNCIGMKLYLFDKWLLPEARERLDMRFYGPELAVMEVAGDGVFRTGSVRSDYQADLLILEGEFSVTANGARMVLKAPAYIDFIGSNIWTWSDLTTSADFRGWLLGMTQPFFRAVVDLLTVKIGDKIFDYMQAPFWSLAEGDARRLDRLLTILFEALGNTGHIAQRDFIQNLMRCYLSDLLDIVLRQKSLSEPNGTQNGIGMIVQFLYLLYTNYAEHHEVQWYAERLLVSPNALSVALKKAYGKSANAFIDELLLEKAKLWLADPNYSVQQVADMLCFSDQSAFGKFFKRCSGISPSAYRCRKGV